MKLGMTGNRNGLSKKAKIAFIELVMDGEFTSLSHGDCVGSDADTHEIATTFGLDTIIHPPKKDNLRAHCKGTVILPEKGYFARNRDIVLTTDYLVGFPATKINPGKGGTWYTIDFALRRKLPVMIIHHDGTIERHNN